MTAVNRSESFSLLTFAFFILHFFPSVLSVSPW
jgi:hypothetical protein